MAKKLTAEDRAAAKQAKQKKVLLILAPILLALIAFQAPKILGGDEPATVADGTATPGDATGAPTPGAGAPAPVATPSAAVAGPKAVLIGVPVGTGKPAQAGDGQLQTFSLFKPRDPFVQAAGSPAAPTDSGGGGTSANKPAGAVGDGKPGVAPGTDGGVPAPGVAPQNGAAAPILYATIAVNGVEEPLQLKQAFPKEEQLFKLVSLKAKKAEIAIAGGKLTQGRTVTLIIGKPITLVNTATGARYRIRLLYTGPSPELVEQFQAAPAPAPAEAP